MTVHHDFISLSPSRNPGPNRPVPLSWIEHEAQHLDLVLDQLEILAKDIHAISRAARADAIYTYLVISFSLFVRDEEALLDTLDARGCLMNGEASAVADMRGRLGKLPDLIEPVFADLKHIRGNGLPTNPEQFAINVFMFTEFVRTEIEENTQQLIEIACNFLTEPDFAALSREIAFRWGAPEGDDKHE